MAIPAYKTDNRTLRTLTVWGGFGPDERVAVAWAIRGKWEHKNKKCWQYITPPRSPDYEQAVFDTLEDCKWKLENY